MARIVVGLSGGVDSSVAAHLLQEEGHEVIALFMRNWHDETVTIHDECPWIEDSNDAMLVAEKLGIPFQVIDLSEEYKERIVDYMFSEYEHGRTPNPDVLCNREIKFDVFLEKALSLGADYVATGHYCRRDEMEVDGKTVYRLLSGVDNNKDQSYFLCQLNQEQLSKALFPIGHLQKSEVRKIATELDLVTADKKDSQGLCFVGKVRLPDFLQQQLAPKKGQVIEIAAETEIPKDYSRLPEQNEWSEKAAPFAFSADLGSVKGEHSGAHYFTIGQRKGLAIGGTPEPLFVIGTDTEHNLIYAGQGEAHPGLRKEALFVAAEDVHWLREDLALKSGEQAHYSARIRYRQPLFPVNLHATDKGLYVLFEEAQKAVTPGQFVAWYQGEELIGSGVIQF
ncbi:tRNA 2-thiouridine(34) synthase MnmA [Croceimicrobium sp.]|uniref:tRNA 2-thiouridine(34) synthase MnmA n=1 Tax=Croceimicrobium sp. TaxID=2828340 RepID=UPI003BA8AD2B